MTYETKIDIMRHGEPVGGPRYRGDGIDDPLSDKGWIQMWAAVEGVTDWSRVITSPLQRCYAFAEVLATRRGLPLIVDKRIREVGFGSWEGRMRQAVMAEDAENYKRFYANPVNARPTGAEPLQAFYKRVTEAIYSVISTYPNEHLLIVAHAGVVRSAVNMVLKGALKEFYSVRVEYATITRIAHSSELGVQLVFHGRECLRAV